MYDALVDLAIATTAVRRAHRLHKSAMQAEHVFHYTSQDTFYTLFPEAKDKPAQYRSPRLLLSPTELLNDPNEGVHFFEILGRYGETMHGLLDGLIYHRQNRRVDLGLSASDPLVFVASLCMEQDNLNLWRFYGGAKGVSFGVHRTRFDFDTEEGLSDDDNSRDKLYVVKYGDDEVEKALNHVMPALASLAKVYRQRVTFQPHIIRSVTGLLGTIAYLFKTTSYEAERECRLLRIQSIGDVRSGKRAKTIGGIVKLESDVEFVHAGPDHPVVTLGPQFDTINPERGQTRAIDRLRVALSRRQPVVRLSAKKYRAPEDHVLVR